MDLGPGQTGVFGGDRYLMYGKEPPDTWSDGRNIQGSTDSLYFLFHTVIFLIPLNVK